MRYSYLLLFYQVTSNISYYILLFVIITLFLYVQGANHIQISQVSSYYACMWSIK